ncbi:MAG: cation diffusion facilitator family transporter [Clostridia bacterium]
MLDYLVRRFVPDYDNPHAPCVRTAYSVLAGAMGIALNLLLFCIKLPIGMLTGSIAITSDAFNNISDMGSSLITLIGARLAGKRPDRDHPFGHGRLEYVSALIVALIILLVGFELLRASAQQFVQRAPVSLTPLSLGLLLFSVLVKLYMFLYNRKLGKKIDSSIMRAAAADSLNDVFTTSAVIVATVIGRYIAWPIDAIAGVAVSLLILLSGYGIARDTINLLLGGRPDPQLEQEIVRLVKEDSRIVGVHDLIIHDYGPGRVMASVHAEVPADADIIRAHEHIDQIEQHILAQLGIPIVIHMDPIIVGNARTDQVHEAVREVVEQVEPHFTMHDFRMTDGDSRINLIFDLVVPIEMTAQARAEATSEIASRLAARDPRYHCVIRVDEG